MKLGIPILTNYCGWYILQLQTSLWRFPLAIVHDNKKLIDEDVWPRNEVYLLLVTFEKLFSLPYCSDTTHTQKSACLRLHHLGAEWAQWSVQYQVSQIPMPWVCIPPDQVPGTLIPYLLASRSPERAHWEMPWVPCQWMEEGTMKVSEGISEMIVMMEISGGWWNPWWLWVNLQLLGKVVLNQCLGWGLIGVVAGMGRSGCEGVGLCYSFQCSTDQECCLEGMCQPSSDPQIHSVMGNQ